MTGIERLRRLAGSQDMGNAWTAMLANELNDIADQIERERACDSDTAENIRLIVGRVIDDMERHILGHEGMEDSPVARWARELRRLGHEAYSCDLLPCSGGHPEWHIQADALEVAKMAWDMVIAFPPCTNLASSGAAWFEQKRRDGRQQMGIGFFLAFTALDHVPKVAIENPVGIMSTLYRKPDQIIQPWMFGHPEQKATCLWLKGLPPLEETDNVKEQMLALPKNQRERLHYLPPSPQRGMLRSKTYPGVARAMAEQWGALAGVSE